MKIRTWLTHQDYRKIADAAFTALQILDADYVGNAYNLFETVGLEDSPYNDAFNFAQLKNLCPNRLVLERVFTRQGISRDSLNEYERVLRKAVEVPPIFRPEQPPEIEKGCDYWGLDDDDEDLPF